MFYRWYADIDVETGDLLRPPECWENDNREVERWAWLSIDNNGSRYTPGCIRSTGTTAEEAIKNAADYRRMLLAGQADAADVARYAEWVKMPKRDERVRIVG